ncbi:Signal peptidase I V [Thalassoglobus neptunius]|uniref:Signal peptidase I n=1 Tax=Thalassoglobus neptunius TaxID=1938619 RepID=A0A5C5X2W1_9PLAN|nr:signal peptidase I [Thalassoglobus neptunius]TWT57454.1 Signal peptidase I V [Thalassoglobus neptunius]
MFRHIAESFLLLGLTVVIFRCFAVEGYLISTGSMAPTLLGFHRRIMCENCHHSFVRGAAFDSDKLIGEVSSTGTSSASASADLSGLPAEPQLMECTHCGSPISNWNEVPRTEGDQLLVDKLAFEFRDPRRWEVIVFHNEDAPGQAYVKRVVGLPNEILEIRDGDIWVNNNIVRKPLENQLSMRVPVHEYSREASFSDPDLLPRWVSENGSESWSFLNSSINCSSSKAPNQPGEISWIKYRHCETQPIPTVNTVHLAHWPEGLSQNHDDSLKFEAGTLSCDGVLSAFERDRWKTRTDDTEFHRALDELFEQSHLSPIIDRCEYNRQTRQQYYFPHDFMISATLEDLRGDGELLFELTDGVDTFQLHILPSQHLITLRDLRHQRDCWTTSIDKDSLTKPIHIDFSLFDQQAIVAVNEKIVGSPVPFQASQSRPPLTSPVRIGARGIDVRIASLNLYRDVYYTPKRDQSDPSFEIPAHHFLVLGDNSPVSLDSRAWAHPTIPREALIGKPLFVHLPTQQKEISWNGKKSHIRIPDFSRVRTVR